MAAKEVSMEGFLIVSLQHMPNVDVIKKMDNWDRKIEKEKTKALSLE